MAIKKNFKKLVVIFITLLLIIPINVLAYSNKVYLGGENIGIEVNSSGILIVGIYKVGNTYPAKDANLRIGDLITHINNNKVNNIDEMIKQIKISNKENISITYLRNHKQNLTNLMLEKQSNGVYKTGLYVKDKITGIGTLTFIDPETNKFGALGHEIIEANSSVKLDIKDGIIYKSEVTSIKKGERGIPGEKNAKYDKNIVFGSIDENTSSGIFGTYNDKINNKKLIDIAQPNEIKLGGATIKTVLKNNEILEYNINIIKLNFTTNTKNILFEVTDKNLLKKTGGVISGMSGSPIIQNNKLIGAVSHVLVDEPTKGYGILITTMLKESDN